jgi:serine/threonine protein kinase
MNHKNIARYHLLPGFKFSPSEKIRTILEQKKIVIVKKQGKVENKDLKVIDALKNGGSLSHCLIEELVPLGFDKINRINDLGNYEDMKKFDMKYQILKGLQYLHDHGITHFDIKDNNFQIMTNGRIFFIDFNISKFTNQVHKYFGTENWKSPEVESKNQIVDQLSDMYPVYKIFSNANIGDYYYRESRLPPFLEIEKMKAEKKELIGFPQYAEKRRGDPDIEERNIQARNGNPCTEEEMKNGYKVIMDIICKEWMELESDQKAKYAQIEVIENQREEAEISMKFANLKKEVNEFELEANKKIYKLFQRIIAAQADTEAVRAFPEPEHEEYRRK